MLMSHEEMKILFALKHFIEDESSGLATEAINRLIACAKLDDKESKLEENKEVIS